MYYILESFFLYNNFFLTFSTRKEVDSFCHDFFKFKRFFSVWNNFNKPLIAFNNLFLFLHSLSRRRSNDNVRIDFRSYGRRDNCVRLYGEELRKYEITYIHVKQTRRNADSLFYSKIARAFTFIDRSLLRHPPPIAPRSRDLARDSHCHDSSRSEI